MQLQRVTDGVSSTIHFVMRRPAQFYHSIKGTGAYLHCTTTPQDVVSNVVCCSLAPLPTTCTVMAVTIDTSTILDTTQLLMLRRAVMCSAKTNVFHPTLYCVVLLCHALLWDALLVADEDDPSNAHHWHAHWRGHWRDRWPGHWRGSCRSPACCQRPVYMASLSQGCSQKIRMASV